MYNDYGYEEIDITYTGYLYHYIGVLNDEFIDINLEDDSYSLFSLISKCDDVLEKIKVNRVCLKKDDYINLINKISELKRDIGDTLFNMYLE